MNAGHHEYNVPGDCLNEGQRKAAKTVIRNGSNCFLTGAAGVGKSYLLKFIIQQLQEIHSEPAVAVTASTGIAATHIGGITIHSFAGIGLGLGSPETLALRACKNSATCVRWRRTKVLVIDEVSMIDSGLFESIDAVARATRKSDQPFGGIQLLFCGDFFQLPPVKLGRFGCTFAFESDTWKAADIRKLELTEVVRQAGDTTFVTLLNSVRVGTLSTAGQQVLARCHVSRKAPPRDGIVPTKLYCTNRKVDEENVAFIDALPGEAIVFGAKDVMKREGESSACQALRDLVEKKSPQLLPLKVGAQVMLTRNMAEIGLVNGSRGVLVSLDEAEVPAMIVDGVQLSRGRRPVPVVRFDNGRLLRVMPTGTFQGLAGGAALLRIQLPLKLAWALTVHKSQGMTLTRAELMLEDAFDFGQAYVALSRVTALEGLWVRGAEISQSVVKAHPSVVQYYLE